MRTKRDRLPPAPAAGRPAPRPSLLTLSDHRMLERIARLPGVGQLGWAKAARGIGYLMSLHRQRGGAGDVDKVWRLVRPADLEPGGVLDRHLSLGIETMRAYAGHGPTDPDVSLRDLWVAVRGKL